MERMTEIAVYVEGGPHIYRVSITKDCDISGSLNNILQRLGQYEDTGLSPEEITTMYITGGYWKKKYEDVYVCSNCNKSNNSPTTFCPHCGCQMTAPMSLTSFEADIANIEKSSSEDQLVTPDYVQHKISMTLPKKRVAVDEDGNVIDYAMYDNDKVFEVPNDWEVHQAHCCVIHGCKYGDPDCPIVNAQIKQSYLCFDCTDSFNFTNTMWEDIHSAYRKRRILYNK